MALAVYVMVVAPASAPLTIPVVLTVATEGSLLSHVQVPPAGLIPRVITLPSHTDAGPLMAAGLLYT